MRFCEKCKVKIINPRERCPLCQSELNITTPTDETETYPYIPTVYKKHSLFIRTLLFASITAGLVCLIINYMFPVNVWWSFIVILGLLYMWMNIYAAMSVTRLVIGKKILQQAVALATVLICIDLITGFYRWSFNIAIPVLFIFALLAITISSKLMGLRLQFFAIYLLIYGMLGILPLMFILTGLCTILEPSLFCIIISALSFTTVFIFADKNTRAELRRKLHI